MASDTVMPPEAESVSRLGASIIADAQDLIKQQVALVRAELKADFRSSVHAAWLLTWGVAAGVPAAILLGNMLVYLLHEIGNFPVWAGNGIVGGGLAVLSVALIMAGRHRFRSINPLPEQAIEAFKENVRWATTPK
jgi:hypothetical protein